MVGMIKLGKFKLHKEDSEEIFLELTNETDFFDIVQIQNIIEMVKSTKTNKNNILLNEHFNYVNDKLILGELHETLSGVAPHTSMPKSPYLRNAYVEEQYMELKETAEVGKKSKLIEEQLLNQIVRK